MMHTRVDGGDDLEVLVPSGTRRRSVALVVSAVVVLVAVGFSPRILSPGLENGGWGASGAFGRADGAVVTTFQSTPRVWPWATVTDVEDVPGATLLGAWLLPTDDVLTALDSVPPDGSQSRTGEQLLAAVFPADRLSESALPAQIRHGEQFTLAMHWRIDDCSALNPDHEPVVHLRTVLGTGATTTLDAVAGPMAGMTREDLADQGVCP